MCNHEWYTYITDHSYDGGWENFSDTISGHHDGSFYNECKSCNIKENYQLYGLSTMVWGHGNKSFRGNLSIEECMAVVGLVELPNVK